ncbi:MAG: site-specific DNA-methyltransferase [Faecalibacterium sp.]
MENLKMHSLDGVQRNIDLIGKLFPNAITEVKRNGKVEHAIDFDVLRQELSDSIVEGREERYQFTWPDKKKAMLAANAPITATLRPVVTDSVGKDGTPGGFDSENLYIEGDNLEVLKLLQETYLGKVKMIYIDPPYNTGNDFVYEDDFAQRTEDYMGNSGQYDEEGNRMVTNTESNGRFHTDWLNMIYPRLKLAKDLLADDGLIFISIDNNEIENLRKICDEVFGESNCVSQLVWKNKYGAGGGTNGVAYIHEYILVYSKKGIESITCDLSDELISAYNKQDEKYAERGGYLTQPLASTSKGVRANLMYPIYHNGVEIHPPKGGRWIWSKEKFDRAYANNEVVINQTKDGWSVRFKQYLRDEEGTMRKGTQLSMITNVFNQDGTKEFSNLIGDKRIFDFPKPTKLISQLLKLEINGASNKDAIILDFFSGSASTASSVMQLNAEDGGHRKFIMVQLPEKTDEKSEAYKAGYKNICEIGKERIRRAGRKIKENAGLTAPVDLDIGFRCLRLDSSNMENVYYTPEEISQQDMFSLVDNVKPDRTPEDLLFQVMLDLGVLLSSPIEVKEIAGKKVFNVADGFLLACFDHDVTEETVKAIAQMKPYYAVFRDSSMANDSVATNFDQIFETYSPETVRKVL